MKITEEEIQNRLLLQKAIEQNCPEAFERIYRQNRDFVEKHIASKIRLEDEEEDLVQIVFMRILQGKCKYTGNSDVRGYLCGIANNVVHNHIREKKRNIKALFLEELSVTNQSSINEQDSEPKYGTSLSPSNRALIMAVGHLPVKSRQAIKQVFFNCVDVSEAAQKLNCSEDTLRKRLKYGIGLLRKNFRPL